MPDPDLRSIAKEMTGEAVALPSQVDQGGDQFRVGDGFSCNQDGCVLRFQIGDVHSVQFFRGCSAYVVSRPLIAAIHSTMFAGGCPANLIPASRSARPRVHKASIDFTVQQARGWAPGVAVLSSERFPFGAYRRPLRSVGPGLDTRLGHFWRPMARSQCRRFRRRLHHRGDAERRFIAKAEGRDSRT
ncbi:hypothetical protein OKW44_004626 [Paraburkholderia sp. WSM4174]